jgi:crotonobetainyl-CoA:carnitine CoA-transferase CaiB-like acyl-CoA transferase
MRFKAAPLTIDRPPPLLDEHRAEILEEFGIDCEQLRESGVA